MIHPYAVDVSVKSPKTKELFFAMDKDVKRFNGKINADKMDEERYESYKEDLIDGEYASFKKRTFHYQFSDYSTAMAFNQKWGKG